MQESAKPESLTRCFSCERPIAEDNQLHGRYVCNNQRCPRFGLLSVIYLAEQTPSEAPQVAEEIKEDSPIKE